MPISMTIAAKGVILSIGTLLQSFFPGAILKKKMPTFFDCTSLNRFLKITVFGLSDFEENLLATHSHLQISVDWYYF
jgi:hypothetical protein